MRTAILISGHMRSFDRCLPTLHWHVFRHFVPAVGAALRADCECDFFVSTEPDEDADKADLLYEKYGAECFHFDDTPQPTEELKDLGAKYEHHAAHAPYAISVPAWQVLAQLWRLERCWQFVLEANPRAAEEPYDVYIRCRPDLWIESASIPEIYHRTSRWPMMALTPWWGRFGGVNDRFAILGHVAATGYFLTWSRVPDLLQSGCPLHPESLIKASLEAAGCRIDDTLDVSFSTLRANGERRFPEIMPQDLHRR